jgi:hypothetical protein
VSRTREELRLLFLLAGCAERRVRLRDEARAALERADFDLLARDLADRRLMGLIGSRAVEAAPDVAPERFRDAVASARASARARGLAVEAVTARLVATLEGAGIRALPLKGPLLASAAHGDLGLRETADVDLLVPAARLEAAVDALRGLGYSDPTDVRRRNGLPDLHFELHRPGGPPIELHWRVYWYEKAFSEKLLAGAEPGPDGLLRAAPDDLMTSLLLFYARDGFHGVRIAADVAAWWDRHGSGLAPGFLDSYVTRFPELEPALVAAADAVERVTGVPATGWLVQRSSAPAGRVAAAARLADWAQAGDRDQMSANISLTGALLRPPGALGEFARREFLLPGEGVAGNVIHAAKVAARYGFALWRVRGAREWVEPPAAVLGAASATPGVQH